MLGYGSFQYGGVVYPIPAVAADTNLLEICDPGLGALLQFFRSLLDAYVGPVLLSAAANDPEITVTIGNILPLDPLRIGSHTTFKFPILCGWRLSADYDNRTIPWRQSTSKIRVAYVLPPLDADRLLALDPILTSVERVIDRSLFQAFDPNFLAGQTVFTVNGICNAKLISTTRGQYQLAQEIDFGAVILDLEVEERQMPHVSGGPFTDSRLQIDNASDTTIDPVFQVAIGGEIDERVTGTAAGVLPTLSGF
ncbi:MAG: hypothetical protein WC551_07645 [Patescibacteria group bacterium]